MSLVEQDPAGRSPGDPPVLLLPKLPHAGDQPLDPVVLGPGALHEDRPAPAVGPGEHLVVRDFLMDRLIREERVPRKALQKVKGIKTSERKRAVRRQQAITTAGETVYKGHRSYDLMIALQQGIRYSVGRMGPTRGRRELQPEDYETKVRQSFPHGGSKTTPPHPSKDFLWKDYMPEVFRSLREMFSIDPAEFMLSICGDKALRELSSPGKSGSVFYLSHDDRFILKTVQKNECKVLQRLLPSYVAHCTQHPDTLLTRFFGLFRIEMGVNRKSARFVVMGNIFRTDLSLHETYDLKGSTQGRFSRRRAPGVTLKDLDLGWTFRLERQWRDKLLYQLQVDAEFLQQCRIMDYSLLVGVHFRNRNQDGLVQPGETGSLDRCPEA